MTRRQLVISRILFAVYLVAVAVLCFGNFQSSEDVPKDLWGLPMDKVVHFLMFFPLPVLAYLAFDRYQAKRRPAILWVAVTVLGGCAYAAFTGCNDYCSCCRLDTIFFLQDLSEFLNIFNRESYQLFCKGFYICHN